MTPEGAAGTSRSPTLAGLIPLVVGLVAGWAAITRRSNGLRVAAGAFASSMLFLFSLSLQFALLAAHLLIAAALSSLSTRATPRS